MVTASRPTSGATPTGTAAGHYELGAAAHPGRRFATAVAELAEVI